ncbi:MAG: flagellar biosynthetic protein FliO, partial [Planctomycetota bacterium]
VVPAESKPLFSDQEWNATQAPVAKSAEATSASSTAMTMLIGLLLVIFVALGLGWALRRMQARKFVGGRSRSLELLETVAIAPRRSLVLVRCGTHWLVIGVGEKELVNVATLPAPAATPDVAATPMPVPTPLTQPSPFGNELSRLLGARTQPGERP